MIYTVVKGVYTSTICPLRVQLGVVYFRRGAVRRMFTFLDSILRTGIIVALQHLSACSMCFFVYLWSPGFAAASAFPTLPQRVFLWSPACPGAVSADFRDLDWNVWITDKSVAQLRDLSCPYS